MCGHCHRFTLLEGTALQVLIIHDKFLINDIMPKLHFLTRGSLLSQLVRIKFHWNCSINCMTQWKKLILISGRYQNHYKKLRESLRKFMLWFSVKVRLCLWSNQYQGFCNGINLSSYWKSNFWYLNKAWSQCVVIAIGLHFWKAMYFNFWSSVINCSSMISCHLHSKLHFLTRGSLLSQLARIKFH